ncbi:MAG: hypothetical protein MJ246_06415 [Clostridia bacterium]|nr:hypothetical protein [Clostridia bacterium]
MLVIPSSVLGHFIMTRRPERLFVYLACILIIYGVIYFAGTISLTARRIQDAGYKGIYALIFYTVILTLLSYG